MLRSAPARATATLMGDAHGFSLSWGAQRHTFPHLALKPAPALPSFVPVAAYKTESASEVLKFARDACADSISLQGGADLRLVAEGDLVSSELRIPPYEGRVEYDGAETDPGAMSCSVACTSRTVAAVCKACAFSETLVVALGWREILFQFISGDDRVCFLVGSTV